MILVKNSKLVFGCLLLAMTLLISACSNDEQEHTQVETCLNHYQAESYQVAKSECLIAAEQGSSTAQWLMARLYRYDLIDEDVDLETAFKWYLRAAKNGHVEAMREVGQSYMYAEGVKKDFKNAYIWLKKAADKRDTEAVFSIGVIFIEGWGRDKDLGSAISWFKRAATDDHKMSINNLAWLFATSETKAYFSPKKAKHWIKKLDVRLDDEKTDEASDTLADSSIFLDTKAAVMAADKNFEQAIELQNQAIANLPDDTSEEQLLIFQKHLDNYLQGKDWRE